MQFLRPGKWLSIRVLTPKIGVRDFRLFMVSLIWYQDLCNHDSTRRKPRTPPLSSCGWVDRK